MIYLIFSVQTQSLVPEDIYELFNPDKCKNKKKIHHDFCHHSV